MLPEVPMAEVREVLRRRGHALRAIARLSQDRAARPGPPGRAHRSLRAPSHWQIRWQVPGRWPARDPSFLGGTSRCRNAWTGFELRIRWGPPDALQRALLGERCVTGPGT